MGQRRLTHIGKRTVAEARAISKTGDNFLFGFFRRVVSSFWD